MIRTTAAIPRASRRTLNNTQSSAALRSHSVAPVLRVHNSSSSASSSSTSKLSSSPSSSTIRSFSICAHRLPSVNLKLQTNQHGTKNLVPVLPMLSVFPRFYHKNVIDHCKNILGLFLQTAKLGSRIIILSFFLICVCSDENPRNVGSLDKNAPNVGTGLVGAPACGDVMKLMVIIIKTNQQNKATFLFTLLGLFN